MEIPFPVDIAHTKANNEYYRDARRLVLSSAIFSALLLVAAAITFVLTPSNWWTTAIVLTLAVLGVVYLGVTFQIRRSLKPPQQLYDTSPLAPAIIAEVNERSMVLLALVDARRDPSQGPARPALAARTVTAISGVPRRVGARVPAIAVAGSHSSRQELYDEITPVPLAWSSRDKSKINEARKAIGEDQWSLLERNLGRVAEVRATKRDLLAL